MYALAVKSGHFAVQLLYSAIPSTMNASQSVDLARITSTSFWAVELYQACAFSTLSNLIRASRAGDFRRG